MLHTKRKPRSFGEKWRSHFIATINVFLFLPMVLVINLIQMLSVFIWPFSQRAFRSVNRMLARAYWGWIVLAQKKIWRIRFVVTGDKILPCENAILISNHQQLTDIPVLLTLADNKGRIGDFKWFVKDIIKYIPGVGWAMLFIDCIFVKRSWAQDEKGIKKTFRHIMDKKIPFWVVSFVEGTRITPQKLAKGQKWAKTHGLYTPKHTLPPKSKGFIATVKGLEGRLDAVYDITIGYPGGIPSLWQYGGLCAREIHMHVRRMPASLLPRDEGGLKTFLFESFARKDTLMASFDIYKKFTAP